MTKQETYDYLRAHGVDFEITEHKAVFNMEECADLHLPYPESEAKNLFIRDDKHAHYYLITVKADKRVNLKDFRRAHGTRPLTFASPEELLDLLKLTPGSVTPLGGLLPGPGLSPAPGPHRRPPQRQHRHHLALGPGAGQRLEREWDHRRNH